MVIVGLAAIVCGIGSSITLRTTKALKNKRDKEQRVAEQEQLAKLLPAAILSKLHADLTSLVHEPVQLGEEEKQLLLQVPGGEYILLRLQIKQRVKEAYR